VDFFHPSSPQLPCKQIRSRGIWGNRRLFHYGSFSNSIPIKCIDITVPPRPKKDAELFRRVDMMRDPSQSRKRCCRNRPNRSKKNPEKANLRKKKQTDPKKNKMMFFYSPKKKKTLDSILRYRLWESRYSDFDE